MKHLLFLNLFFFIASNLHAVANSDEYAVNPTYDEELDAFEDGFSSFRHLLRSRRKKYKRKQRKQKKRKRGIKNENAIDKTCSRDAIGYAESYPSETSIDEVRFSKGMKFLIH